jgi:hypothetical protein
MAGSGGNTIGGCGSVPPGPPIVEVPTLDQAGMILLVVVLAGAALVVMRRRRAA